jgi:medium-chain acyl-[acyl-carrier-protein] hydrolase
VTSDNAWVHYPLPRPHAATRLFCFPYAGATDQAYREFARELPDRIEVAELRLPSVHRMDMMIDLLADALCAHLNKPCAFFGHSMGAHIAFELARHLVAAELPGPERLLVSGCPAPQEQRGDRRRLPPNLNRLRADLLMAQTYEYQPGPPLDMPIHAFHGSADPIAGNEQMAEWVTLTTRYFTITELNGDHFFVNSGLQQLVAGITTAIG